MRAVTQTGGAANHAQCPQAGDRCQCPRGDTQAGSELSLACLSATPGLGGRGSQGGCGWRGRSPRAGGQHHTRRAEGRGRERAASPRQQGRGQAPPHSWPLGPLLRQTCCSWSQERPSRPVTRAQHLRAFPGSSSSRSPLGPARPRRVWEVSTFPRQKGTFFLHMGGGGIQLNPLSSNAERVTGGNYQVSTVSFRAARAPL